MALVCVASSKALAGPAGGTAVATAQHVERALKGDTAAGFSGAVLVARAGRVVVLRGFGNAAGRKIRATNRFWVASVGKQFAAAAVMRLVEDGKLNLDDRLGEFFPDAPSDKASITLRQLLSHTSGFGQSYVSELQTDRTTAVRRMLGEPLAGAPGSGFRYSNTNIQLAAAVVETRSGQPYAQFVKRRLWRPAGLKATGFAGDPGAAMVLPISGELPKRLRARYWGEQGVYSSAPDLYRWYNALARGRVLKPSLVAKMFAPSVKIGEGHATLGWFRGRTSAGNDYIFIRGNEDFGANSLVYAYPAKDVAIIVLTHAGNAEEDLSWSRRILRQIEASLAL